MDYLGLNVTLNTQLSLKIDFSGTETVEYKARHLKDNLKKVLRESLIPESVLEIIFIQDTILSKNLSDFDYQTLLSQNRGENLIALLCTIYLDFYSFEHALRRETFPDFNSKSLSTLIKTPKDTLESVIFKSQYYKKLSGLNVETYRKVFDEYLYEFLKPYQYKSIGIDGIVSKSIMWVLELENACIVEKSKRLKVDGTMIVRRYHDQ